MISYMFMFTTPNEYHSNYCITKCSSWNMIQCSLIIKYKSPLNTITFLQNAKMERKYCDNKMRGKDEMNVCLKVTYWVILGLGRFFFQVF